MGPETPLHRALAAWRHAEHRLDLAGSDDPELPRLRADVERHRLLYQELFGAIREVAGHGARFGDDEPPGVAGPRWPPRIEGAGADAEGDPDEGSDR